MTGKGKVSEFVDQRERDRALDPAASFIIQAPAGSGKTGLLIQRYLKLLVLVNEPEEIIAITFTRKAAAEMRNRILEALEMAMRERPSEDDHGKKIAALAGAVLKRDRVRDWRILDNPARLRIQTIDSLCASLTRQMPLMSRLGTRPDLLEDATDLYRQAAANTLRELEGNKSWSEAIAGLILLMDNNLPYLRDLIVDMLRKRDQWLRYVVREHDRDDMERSLVDLIEDQLKVVKNIFPRQCIDKLVSLAQFAARHLPEDGADNPVRHCTGLSILPSTDVAAFEKWLGICELLLTRKGEWRRRFSAKEGFPSQAGRKAEEAEEYRARKEQATGLIVELRRSAGLRQALRRVRVLPPVYYTDAEWEIVQALCELLKLATGHLRLLFAEHNQMDFIGVAEAAYEALGPEDNPTDLALVLDYRIKHLLVDEYQDISFSQYRLLHALTREWSTGDNRSLFLVGDPMQSIYRFREAEVGLFIKTFEERCLGNVPLQSLRLQVNFRSQQAIVQWVNDHFKHIFPARNDVFTGAVSFSEAKAHRPSVDGAGVFVHSLYGTSILEEAHHAADVIEETRRKYSGETIAVLVRSRLHLQKLIPLLHTAGIDFEAIEIESLGTRGAIQDLLALLCAFLFPAERVAWLACLRAPWCGLTLNSLFCLAQDRNKTLWDSIDDAALIAKLDEGDRTRLERLKTAFIEAFNERQRLPLRQMLETLWRRLGGPATLNSEAELENCERFFQLVERLDKSGGIDDLAELERRVDGLFASAPPTTDKPVQIMTMHKAKGLEFDHVILPCLGRSPRFSQRDLMIWLLRHDARREQLIMAPLPAIEDTEKGRFSPIYHYIDMIDKDRQIFEEVRLLYVAATRSKCSLHLIGHVELPRQGAAPQPRNRSLLSLLWPVVKSDYQGGATLAHAPGNGKADFIVSQETRRLADPWTPPVPLKRIKQPEAVRYRIKYPQETVEFEWAGDVIRHVGSVVHQVLWWIATEGLEHWQDARIRSSRPLFNRMLQQQGVSKDMLPLALGRVQDALSNTLADERGQWILSTQHGQPRNEYPITGFYCGELVNAILDRTFIDEQDIRWIIDYKTGRYDGADPEAFLNQEQERYREQLETYAALMWRPGGVPIRLGLYFPLLRGWREWSFDARTIA